MNKINYSFYIFLTYIIYRVFISNEYIEDKKIKKNINNQQNLKKEVKIVNDNKIKNNTDTKFKIHKKFKIKKIINKVDKNIKFDKNIRKFVQVINPVSDIENKEKEIKKVIKNINKIISQKKDKKNIIIKKEIKKITKNISNEKIKEAEKVIKKIIKKLDKNDKKKVKKQTKKEIKILAKKIIQTEKKEKENNIKDIIKNAETERNSNQVITNNSKEQIDNSTESPTIDKNLMKNIIKPLNSQIKDKIKNIRNILSKNKENKEFSIVVSKSSSANEKKIIDKQIIGNDGRVSNNGYFHIKDNLSIEKNYKYPQENNNFNNINNNIERMSDIILKQNKENMVDEFSNVDKLNDTTNRNDRILEEEERIHENYQHYKDRKLNTYDDDLNPKNSLRYKPLLKCHLEKTQNSRIMDIYDNFTINPEKDSKLKKDMYSFVEQYKECGY